MGLENLLLNLQVQVNFQLADKAGLMLMSKT
jgi:hypothetical protein